MNTLDTTSCRLPQHVQVSLLTHASTRFVATLRKKLNNKAVADVAILDSGCTMKMASNTVREEIARSKALFGGTLRLRVRSHTSKLSYLTLKFFVDRPDFVHQRAQRCWKGESSRDPLSLESWINLVQCGSLSMHAE